MAGSILMEEPCWRRRVDNPSIDGREDKQSPTLAGRRLRHALETHGGLRPAGLPIIRRSPDAFPVIYSRSSRIRCRSCRDSCPLLAALSAPLCTMASTPALGDLRSVFLDANEIGCARISVMAGAIAPFKGPNTDEQEPIISRPS